MKMNVFLKAVTAISVLLIFPLNTFAVLIRISRRAAFQAPGLSFLKIFTHAAQFVFMLLFFFSRPRHHFICKTSLECVTQVLAPKVDLARCAYVQMLSHLFYSVDKQWHLYLHF